MIKFFRQIRQRLLRENRFSSYFLYAVGEIVLVVIGILIALQINNWNEERKRADTADALLHDLYDELAANQKHFGQMNEGNSQYIRYLETVLLQWDSLDYALVNSLEKNEFARLHFSTLFYLTSYSQFNDPKREIFDKAINDGTISLIDQDLVQFISRILDMNERLNEIIAQEYELGQEMNLHIAESYQAILLNIKPSEQSDLEPEILDKLFIAFRRDGKLKYLVNARLELATIRNKLLKGYEMNITEQLEAYEADHPQ